MIRKLFVFTLLTALLMLAVMPAFAATNAEVSAVKDFKFFRFKSGIGCGLCPVYTAPDPNAYRIGGEQCQTNAEIFVAGMTRGGWLLVQYATNDGGTRVGYIPPEYVSGFKLDGIDYVRDSFGSGLAFTAAEDIRITDDPMAPGSAFAVIPAGGVFSVIATYTYSNDWWYVETAVGGQTARGFIDREATQLFTDEGLYSVRCPDRSPLGTEQQGWVTVNANATMARRDADPGSEMTGRLSAGSEYACYGEKTGTTDTAWYYIYIYDQNAWGWVVGSRVTVK